MLVIETLKRKISDFLNSNTCFCSQLYGIQNTATKWFWDPLCNMTKGEQKADNTLQKIWSGKYNH